MFKKIIIGLVLLLCMISLSNAVPTTGNFNYFTLDDANISGVQVFDVINNNDGTSVNAPTTGVAGIIKQGFNMDGSNDYVNTNNSQELLTAWTVNVWINPDTTPTQVIFGFLDGNDIMLQQLSTDVIRIYAQGSGGGSSQDGTTGVTAASGWNMITGVYDGTDARLYINGVLDATHVAADGTFNTSVVSIVPVGAGFQGGIIQNFDGQIDEFGFWNISLNQGNVTELYRGGLGLSYKNFTSEAPPPGVPTNAPIPLANITNGTIFNTNNISFLVNASGSIANISYLLNPVLLGNSSRVLYMNFDNNTQDFSGTGNNGTIVNSANYTTGLFGLSVKTGAQTQQSYINILDDATLDFSTEFTLLGWFNRSGFRDDSGLFVKYGTSGNQRSYRLVEDSVNELRYGISSDGTSSGLNQRTTASDCGFTINDVWVHIAFRYNTTHISIYRNGTLCESNVTSVASIFSSTADFRLGFYQPGSDWFNGKIDEVQAFNTALSSSTIFQIFNETIIQICSDCLNGTLNLINLVDLQHNIRFTSFNNSGSGQTFYNFIIDTTQPNLTVSFPAEINSYFNFNVSSFINVSDLNLDTCIVRIENEPTTTCFEEDYNFTFNGNVTINVTANDTAGNTISSLNNLMLINPFQTFKFRNNVTTILIENYTFGSFSSNLTEVKIKIFDLGIGASTLEFVKFGFPRQNFTVTFTNTSNLNITFNVTPVTIVITVFDESNASRQLTFDATFQNSTDIKLFLDQVNFSQQFDNITSGSISILIESNGFDSRKLFTTIDPFTNIVFTLFLLNSSLATPVIFEVTDVSGALSIEDATLNFFKLIGNATAFVGQARTDSQGTTFFNMGLNDEYEIIVNADTFETLTFNSVPGRVLYNVVMTKIGVDSDFVFNNFGYKFIPTGGFISTLPFNTSVVVSDSSSDITLMTFTVTGNNTFFQTTSTVPGGATLGPFLVVNFSETYLLNLTVIRNGETIIFLKTLTFLNETDSVVSLKAAALQLQGEENNADRVGMMILSYVAFVGIGTIIGGILFGVMAGLIPISFFVLVQWISLDPITNVGGGLLLALFTVVGGLFFNK